MSGTEQDPEAATRRPMLTIVSGDPTPEELAALTVVLACSSGGQSEPDRPPRSFWADRASLLRRPVTPGPRMWVASGRRF